MWLLVRTKGDAEAIAPAVRQEIRNLDPDVPVDRAGRWPKYGRIRILRAFAPC